MTGYLSQADKVRELVALIEDEGCTFGDLGVLRQLVELETTVREAIARTGSSLRVGGASYGELGTAVGISKQAARKRFGP